MLYKFLDKPKDILSRHFDRKTIRACMGTLLSNILSEYGGRIDLGIARKVPVGFGQTDDFIGCELPLKMTLGMQEFYSDGSDKMSFDDVSWLDVTRFIVSTYHECRHVEQFENMQNGIGENVDRLSLFHLAKQNNGQYYTHNRYAVVTEVDAERFGINRAGQFLSECVGQGRADRYILDYVNDELLRGVYYIPMCNGKRKYDSISDVLDAFDSAYDVAMHKPYDYEIKKCNDVAQTVLYGEMSDVARKSFFEQSDSFVQDMMVSAINLYKFPEYQGWHKSLQNMDLSMEAQFGLDWQKQDSTKSRRRLPDVDLLCEGQQSEYEF